MLNIRTWVPVRTVVGT